MGANSEVVRLPRLLVNISGPPFKLFHVGINLQPCSHGRSSNKVSALPTCVLACLQNRVLRPLSKGVEHFDISRALTLPYMWPHTSPTCPVQSLLTPTINYDHSCKFDNSGRLPSFPLLPRWIQKSARFSDPLRKAAHKFALHRQPSRPSRSENADLNCPDSFSN